MTLVVSTQSRLFLRTAALDKALETARDTLDVTAPLANDSSVIHLGDMKRDLGRESVQCRLEAIDDCRVRARHLNDEVVIMERSECNVDIVGLFDLGYLPESKTTVKSLKFFCQLEAEDNLERRTLMRQCSQW